MEQQLEERGGMEEEEEKRSTFDSPPEVLSNFSAVVAPMPTFV